MTTTAVSTISATRGLGPRPDGPPREPGQPAVHGRDHQGHDAAGHVVPDDQDQRDDDQHGGEPEHDEEQVPEHRHAARAEELLGHHTTGSMRSRSKGETWPR